MTKKTIISRLCLPIILVSFVLVLLTPSPSYASDLCPNVTDSSKGIVKGIVECVKEQFNDGITKLIQKLSEFLEPIVGVMFSIAVLFFGIRVMGKGAGWADALGFMARIAIVGAYWGGMGAFASDFMSAPDELISWTSSGGSDPWDTIDKFMQKILGYGAKFTLASGLLGILAGSMFASSFGFALFLFGFKAIMDLIFMVVQAIFIYLTAFMVIAFMFAVSPLIVPLALFGVTEHYVKGWINTIVACMLTPMLLMICLNTFLPMIPGYVDAIFEDLGVEDSDNSPKDFSTFWRSQQSAFAWLMPSDPNLTQKVEDNSGVKLQNPVIPASQTAMMRQAGNASQFDLSGINFGPNTIGIMKSLLLDFVALIIVTYILRSLIDQMPVIASNIADGAGSGVFKMQATAAESQIKAQVAKIEKSLKTG